MAGTTQRRNNKNYGISKHNKVAVESFNDLNTNQIKREKLKLHK